MAMASPTTPESGFSQKTGMPASTPALISAECASVAAAITMPSTPLPISAAGEVAASASNLSATAAVTAGTASVTTSESTPSRWERVSAWNAPILPRPIRPIRMTASFATSGGGTAAGHSPRPPMTFWSQSMTDPVTTPLQVGQQERDEVGDLVDLAELTDREGRGGPLLPVAGALGGCVADFGRFWIRSSPSVADQPMFNPLIRIRSHRCAWAALRVRPARPAFAATYGARND